MKVIMKKELNILYKWDKYCFLYERDKYLSVWLQKLRHTESDRLSVQVHAYVDNMIEVAQLLEDSELKTEAIERAEDLEEELSRVSEVIWLVS